MRSTLLTEKGTKRGTERGERTQISTFRIVQFAVLHSTSKTIVYRKTNRNKGRIRRKNEGPD